MKKFLENLISRKQQAIADMRKQAKDSQDINEVRSLGEQIAAAQEEIEEARAKLAECNTRLDNTMRTIQGQQLILRHLYQHQTGPAHSTAEDYRSMCRAVRAGEAERAIAILSDNYRRAEPVIMQALEA